MNDIISPIARRLLLVTFITAGIVSGAIGFIDMVSDKNKITGETYLKKHQDTIGKLLVEEWGVPQLEANAYAITLRELGNKYQTHWSYFAALIGHESSFNPYAVGTAGEVGLGQLREATLEQVCKKERIPYVKAKTGFNGVANITASAAYLMESYRVTGNWEDAYKRYNGGPLYRKNGENFSGIATKHKIYALSVLALANIIREWERSL